MAIVSGDGVSQVSRMPPWNQEAEQSVLGSMLLSREAIDEACGNLSADDFYLDAHQNIFRAIISMHADGLKVVDPVTLAEQLSSHGSLEDCGDIRYLHDLLEAVPHAGHVVYYGDIVREKAQRRRLIELGNSCIREAFDLSQEIPDVIASAEHRIHVVSECVAGPGDRTSVRDVMIDCLSRIGMAVQEGVNSGFARLDEMTHGFQQGHLIVLAARPSVGKTAIACNMALHAGRNGDRVMFVSLEQPKEELGNRMIAIESRIDSHAFRKGLIDEAQRQMVLEATERIGAMPISIDDEPAQTVTKIAARIRREKRKRDIQIAFIDYLQIIEPEETRIMSREQQVASMTRRLKNVARQLKIPIVLLAQLNRQSETAADKKPRLHHLRESGAIEQDANIVLLLHRKVAPEQGDSDVSTTTLIVAKNRDGETSEIGLKYRPATLTFVDAQTENERRYNPDQSGGLFT